MNFGETLAYWYLRLNGFFPLTDFVLHRDEETIEHSADTDLLAVRFPFVYEEVGGQLDDWDNNRFTDWGLDLNRKIVALIVEVKTGKNNPAYRDNIRQSFSRDRLLYGIHRMGFWQRIRTDEIASDLSLASIYHDAVLGVSIAKLLIAVRFPQNEQLLPCCLKLRLDEAEEFILARVDKYPQKQADRLRFPSDLVQYLIWSRRTRDRQRNNANSSNQIN